MNALSVPFTMMMNTRDIAAVADKLHAHVIRDAKAMIVSLYADEIVDRIIPDDRRARRSEFVREAADALLSELSGDEPNWVHPSGGVSWTRDARGYISTISLDYSHAMTLVSGYDVVRRAAIIDRWIELEQAARKPAPDYVTRAEFEALRAEVRGSRAPKIAPTLPDRMRNFIRKRGQATKTDLLRNLRGVTAAQCNSALSRLCVEGHVQIILVSPPRSGRPASVCRWIQ